MSAHTEAWGSPGWTLATRPKFLGDSQALLILTMAQGCQGHRTHSVEGGWQAEAARTLKVTQVWVSPVGHCSQVYVKPRSGAEHRLADGQAAQERLTCCGCRAHLGDWFPTLPLRSISGSPRDSKSSHFLRKAHDLTQQSKPQPSEQPQENGYSRARTILRHFTGSQEDPRFFPSKHPLF